MTRRERLERKLEKRREWAEKAEARSTTAYTTSRAILDPIPLGQPILVGHHSEKRHRRALERADNAMRRASEESKLAAHHESRADGIESQLERTIFSDDADAVDQLTRKAEGLKAKREQYKQLNGWWRKHGTMKGCPGVSDETAARLDADIPERYSWERQPIPKYKLSNIGAEIRRCEQRIEEIRARAQRSEQAQQSGGVLIEGAADYVAVTFAEKPAREVLEALKAAGFHWSGGSWCGYREKLPASVQPSADA